MPAIVKLQISLETLAEAISSLDLTENGFSPNSESEAEDDISKTFSCSTFAKSGGTLFISNVAGNRYLLV